MRRQKNEILEELLAAADAMLDGAAKGDSGATEDAIEWAANMEECLDYADKTGRDEQ